MKQAVIRETTQNFCDAFITDKDCTGFTAKLVGEGLLPDMVDSDDPRVVDIIKRCQKLTGKPNNPSAEKGKE